MAAPQLGRAQLEEKDRDDLEQIAGALGIKGIARASRDTLIGKILEETMTPEPKETTTPKTSAKSSTANSGNTGSSANTVPLGADGEPLSEWELELAEHEGTPVAPDARVRTDRSGDRGDSRGDRNDRDDRGDSRGGDRGFRDRNDRNFNDRGGDRNRRRRGRRRGGRDEGPQGDDRFEIDHVDSNEPVSTEPVKVEGYLDLRDEGYGFLRLGGYLPTRNDAYVSVRFTRQFGLRKGDHITGLSRPAGRNEKNPALLEVYTVNGGDPEKARGRKKFEELTPLFPDEKLVLSSSSEPLNMTARIVDLISPIGKGQRGIIVSPPKAGKTTVMKTIATSIEKNHPEVKLIVLLIDERPEEVTDMRRTVKGEVIASTFDRPSDEHTAVAELAVEKAKRMVEAGEDVVIILDGITRLSRAYNLAAPATGRIMSGGIDAGALYPPKKFFGAARNVEEGGSLTILATALVDTNSRMDEAIFEEFKGTGNMELRLDRRLAERRIYPAIDVDASSTRHEELLFDRKQLQMVWKLRRVLSGLAADGNAAPGLELLIDRLKSFKTNDEFLSEIAKQPTA
ncbi:MAG: transcription termination factor Rho [Ilumatobacteraceae bacterium]